MTAADLEKCTYEQSNHIPHLSKRSGGQVIRHNPPGTADSRFSYVFSQRFHNMFRTSASAAAGKLYMTYSSG